MTTRKSFLECKSIDEFRSGIRCLGAEEETNSESSPNPRPSRGPSTPSQLRRRKQTRKSSARNSRFSNCKTEGGGSMAGEMEEGANNTDQPSPNPDPEPSTPPPRGVQRRDQTGGKKSAHDLRAILDSFTYRGGVRSMGAKEETTTTTTNSSPSPSTPPPPPPLWRRNKTGKPSTVEVMTTTTTRKSCIAKCKSVKEKGGGGIRCMGGAKEGANNNNDNQSSPNPAPKPTTNQDLLAMLDSFRYTGGGGGVTSMRAEETSSKSSPNPNPSSPKTIKRRSPPLGVGVIVDGPDEEKGKKKRRKSKEEEAKLREEEVVVTNNRKRRKTEMNVEEEEDQKGKKKSKPRSVMTVKEKYMDCYKRVETGNTWEPPVSPYGLLQEYHYADPWRVLVICMLLNITTGTQVNRVLDEIFALCPNAEAAINVRQEDLASLIKPLGLSDLRSKRIMKLSRQYLENDWTHVTQLHGVGKYAADAYAIFCVGKPDQVIPEDHKLVDYWKFVCKMRTEELHKQFIS